MPVRFGEPQNFKNGLLQQMEPSWGLFAPLIMQRMGCCGDMPSYAQKVSVPSNPSLAAFYPSTNSKGRTAISRKPLRWIRPNLSAITALTPKKNYFHIRLLP